MKKILVCCNSGVSTSLLVNKLEASIAATGAELEVSALPLAQAIDELAASDVVLLAPQVGFAADNLKEATKAPVAVIDPDAYARADTEAILQQINELLA